MIKFNKPYLTKKEKIYIDEVLENGHYSGDGNFTKRCCEWIEEATKCHKALITHSCTAALEISAILANIQYGDEIIMPSYTFVSTANAFVLRGGIPVFVDIKSDCLNINECLIEDAITSRTKAIVPVHYAGVSCEMDSIINIANRHDLMVIEDAAQSLMSTYKDRALGTIGDLGCLSFHETKNLMCGEGGALQINSPLLATRAEIILEKGTNRKRFLRGEIDKYTWCDIGSSFLPGEITAAFLLAQLESAKEITQKRIDIWNKYHDAFEQFEQKGIIHRPVIPEACKHNAHIYYLILPDQKSRDTFIERLKVKDIQTVFHYVPLHSSIAGKNYGKVIGDLPVTDDMSSRLVRLPLWVGLEFQIEEIIEQVSLCLLSL